MFGYLSNGYKVIWGNTTLRPLFVAVQKGSSKVTTLRQSQKWSLMKGAMGERNEVENNLDLLINDTEKFTLSSVPILVSSH